MRERRDGGQNDLFKARLDQIVYMNHPLAKLARTVDWGILETSFGAVYNDRRGQTPLPARLISGIAVLNHMHDLSDEVLCECWIENPIINCSAARNSSSMSFPFDRSSMTGRRRRMGDEKLVTLLQECLSTAIRTDAAKPFDFAKVIVEKAMAFSTDARLMHRARSVRLAKRHGVTRRHSYARVGKLALVK